MQNTPKVLASLDTLLHSLKLKRFRPEELGKIQCLVQKIRKTTEQIHRELNEQLPRNPKEVYYPKEKPGR